MDSEFWGCNEVARSGRLLASPTVGQDSVPVCGGIDSLVGLIETAGPEVSTTAELVEALEPSILFAASMSRLVTGVLLVSRGGVTVVVAAACALDDSDEDPALDCDELADSTLDGRAVVVVEAEVPISFWAASGATDLLKFSSAGDVLDGALLSAFVASTAMGLVVVSNGMTLDAAPGAAVWGTSDVALALVALNCPWTC